MTRRQQLLLFVLALATVSTCTVAFALAMSYGRQMAVPVSASGDFSRAGAGAEPELAYKVPPPDVIAADSAAQVAPVGPAESPAGWQQPVIEPTSTPTRPPTPTNTRVPTWTPSPTYTPTATRVPTNTPVPTPTDTPVPAPANRGSPSASAPAATPPTPTPEFPNYTMVRVFDTGSPQVTRVTGMVWKIISVNLALYDGEPGYQMRLVDPNGNVYISDVSGIGGTDSTCNDCGDNQRMNMKIEFSPSLPGTYRVSLLYGEEQMAPEVEFIMAANPVQYIHVNFVPWQK